MALPLVFHAPHHGTVGALHAADWRSDAFDFWAFDRRVDELAARGQPLRVVAAGDLAELRHEIALRTQRIAPVGNTASMEPWFTRVLSEHRALHDLDKPLVRADLDHALDAWQWSLRLAPDAAPEIQLAALLHDIERLVSEADVRVEHHAANYQAFKDAHARAGADLARELLARAGAPVQICEATCDLIAIHERVSERADVRAINDADALSFFSLNSPGYLAYFGPEQTARKVAYTLARMSPAARAWLVGIRMPRFVRDRAFHDQRA